ncbi:MAG: M23 family metallopeptidase [Chryseobacterium sp.]|nr:M23 family metallopeptidase [Chryseobacterium sp.]
MKTTVIRALLVIFLSLHLSAFAQFNTLIPTLPKKTDQPVLAEKTMGTDDSKKENDKNFFKNLFKGTHKADLKKELDSLKTMIKENSRSNSKKWDVQKLKDSLILELQGQVFNRAQNDFENRPAKAEISKITMPLDRAISVTSPYGKRIHPLFGTARMHSGIDLKAYYENVYAVMDGIVTETGWDPRGGGHFIKVKHYNYFETAYLHLSEIYYKAGEFVKAGFVIAKSGNTGNSTGAHLHFAVRENGKHINPVRFLNDLTYAQHLIASPSQNERNYYEK